MASTLIICTSLTVHSFVIVMLVGAAVSRFLTPETCNANGKSRRLEDLAKGKAFRRDMDHTERVTVHSR